MNEINVSIIICTQNRPTSIIRCLDSILVAIRHCEPATTVEIIVVDNASTDNTSDVLKAWSATCLVPIHLVYEPRKGASIARNAGLRAAKGKILVLTDDDCCLSESYLTDALRHFAEYKGPALRCGRVELGDPTDLPFTTMTYPTARRVHKDLQSARTQNVGNRVLTANMTMSRDVAESVGFFDEDIGAGTRIAGGEDTDYALRAYLAGAAIDYVPDMMVLHYHGRKDPAEVATLFRKYAEGTGALYAKYLFRDYNLCRQYYWDVKSAISELAGRPNTHMPEFGFSHGLKVVYCTIGAVKYVGYSLGALFKRQWTT